MAVTDHEEDANIHTKEVKNVVSSSESNEETQIGEHKEKKGHKKKDAFATKLADGVGKVAEKHVEGACKCKAGKGCACKPPKASKVVHNVGDDNDDLAQEDEEDLDL